MAAADIFNAFGDKLLDPSISDAFDGLVLLISISSCVFLGIVLVFLLVF